MTREDREKLHAAVRILAGKGVPRKEIGRLTGIKSSSTFSYILSEKSRAASKARSVKAFKVVKADPEKYQERREEHRRLDAYYRRRPASRALQLARKKRQREKLAA